jgi:Spy/CpxP family protein refolding chaperone
MRKTIVFGLIVLFLFSAVISIAQPQEQITPPPDRPMHKSFLNLTDEQKKDFQKINFDFTKQRIDLKAKIENARLDLRQLMAADAPDQSAVEKKAGEVGNLAVKMRVLGVNQWFAVNKMLTPEQQKLWKEHFGQGMREGRGPRLERDENPCCGPMGPRGRRMGPPPDAPMMPPR